MLALLAVAVLGASAVAAAGAMVFAFFAVQVYGSEQPRRFLVQRTGRG